MTFYNYIESARYEMFRLVNGWTREGAETKARISESLDNARIEYMQKESENAKLRELLKNALTYIEYEGCGVECPETGSSATLTSCDTCNRYETKSCAYVIEQDARELGIEV